MICGRWPLGGSPVLPRAGRTVTCVERGQAGARPSDRGSRCRGRFPATPSAPSRVRQRQQGRLGRAAAVRPRPDHPRRPARSAWPVFGRGGAGRRAPRGSAGPPEGPPGPDYPAPARWRAGPRRTARGIPRSSSRAAVAERATCEATRALQVQGGGSTSHSDAPGPSTGCVAAPPR